MSSGSCDRSPLAWRHGDVPMSHLAMTYMVDGKNVDWQEPSPTNSISNPEVR